MTRNEYLKFVEGIYQAARGLIKITPDQKLDFKPKEGLMTIAQILKHISGSLGEGLSVAINNTWPTISPDDMLPSADKLPKSNSAAEALQEIEHDWELLKQVFEKITDGEFNQNKINVPWMPQPMTYVEYMMQAMEHLSNHRMQLFIWLKLSGEPLNTGHLYGMPS